jgi:hypothetical protein
VSPLYTVREVGQSVIDVHVVSNKYPCIVPAAHSTGGSSQLKTSRVRMKTTSGHDQQRLLPEEVRSGHATVNGGESSSKATADAEGSGNCLYYV